MTGMIAKEWRRLLRNPATPWALGAYLLLPVLVTGAYLAGMTGNSGIPPQIISQLGGQTLNLIGTWQILMLAAGAPFVAAGLIAGEVEEGTMQPLMAAGPSLFSLVLGKLAAAVGFLLVVLIAGLPLFAIPLLMGGINWMLVGRTVLMELTTIMMMTGIGLLLSAFGRRVGSVALVGVGLGVMLTLGGGLVETTAPERTYTQNELIMRLALSSIPPNVPVVQSETVPAWLYANPLVGLNSAINQSAGQGIFGLPGVSAPPIYRGYPLWQAQAAGSVLLLLVTTLVTILVVQIRTRWRWPVIRQRRRKEGISVG